MPITFHQVLKSALGVVCGAGFGVFCWRVLEYSGGYALFIGGVGSFIGFALSLPGVSVWRVAGGTAGVLVGYNLGEGIGGHVYDAIAGEDPYPASEPDEPEEDEPPPDQPPSDATV
jgi:hypothetical protein